MKKRSIWQRIQAVICFLLLLCVFVPFGAVAISPGMARDLIVLVDGQQVTGLAAAMDGVVPSMRVVYGVAAVIGLLCSLRMLTLVFARGGRDRSGVSLQNASDGPIHISVPAVETLVSQGIRDVPGLSDVRMKVHDYGDSVTIEIAMSARSDINIPETMMRLQSRIKAYVQESAGIEVREVRLNVEKVVLADGIQALPAGRGMKRVPASEQENSTPTLAAKPESAKPEAPKSAPPQPATAASTVEDDDDTDTDWNRKGWFGRFGHKKRETDADASVDASAAARAAQGDDAATVPSQAPETGDEISIKAHIAEYLTGEAPQAADGQPDPLGMRIPMRQLKPARLLRRHGLRLLKLPLKRRLRLRPKRIQLSKPKLVLSRRPRLRLLPSLLTRPRRHLTPSRSRKSRQLLILRRQPSSLLKPSPSSRAANPSRPLRLM